jgi:type I restriction enzyme S subunit
MFRKETEFQETEIGEFPKEWKVRRLNEIAELQRGLSYSGREKSKDEIPDGYLFLTLNSIKEGGGLKEDGWTWIKSDRLKERHFVKEGDIVIANTEQSKDGSLIGSPAIVRFPKWYKKDKAVFSHHISKLLLRISNMDVNFLFYYLSFAQPLARKYHTGTGVWGLNVDSWARDLLIPLPPLEEQKMIANILSMIDSGIEAVDRAIAKLERMKRALLNELLTGRIRVRDENGKLTFYKETEFQETEIGEMPKDWKIEKLKNIVIKAKMGGTPRSTVREYWGGDIPFAKVEDITSSHKYLFKTSTTITKLGLENSNAWIIPKDSLLITIYGTLGAVAINKIELATNQAIVGIIPRKDIVDVEYLYYWYSFFQPNWNKYVKKSTQPNLTLEIVTNSKLPLPSIKEQKRITDILSTIDSSIELYYREKEKLLRLRRGLMGVLLTGRVRVVSDVRDVGVVV